MTTPFPYLPVAPPQPATPPPRRISGTGIASGALAIASGSIVASVYAMAVMSLMLLGALSGGQLRLPFAVFGGFMVITPLYAIALSVSGIVTCVTRGRVRIVTGVLQFVGGILGFSLMTWWLGPVGLLHLSSLLFLGLLAGGCLSFPWNSGRDDVQPARPVPPAHGPYGWDHHGSPWQQPGNPPR